MSAADTVSRSEFETLRAQVAQIALFSGFAEHAEVAGIVDAVSRASGISVIELLSERKQRGVIRARFAAMWLARRRTTKSLPQIGRVFRRDHTTVMHGIARCERLIEHDVAMQAMIAHAEALIAASRAQRKAGQ